MDKNIVFCLQQHIAWRSGQRMGKIALSWLLRLSKKWQNIFKHQRIWCTCLREALPLHAYSTTSLIHENSYFFLYDLFLKGIFSQMRRDERYTMQVCQNKFSIFLRFSFIALIISVCSLSKFQRYFHFVFSVSKKLILHFRNASKGAANSLLVIGM